MEVTLGKPMLENVSEAGIAMAWSSVPPPALGEPASGEHSEEVIEIDVAVDLDPWPNHEWLLHWREGDLEWPERFDEPLLDGRRLIFGAPEDDLQDAWEAVKARVESANLMYREDHEGLPEDDELDSEELESLRRLREAAQRRIDELN